MKPSPALQQELFLAREELFLAHVGSIGQALHVDGHAASVFVEAEALHVDGHAASVFVEAEVRASVVFQLSRIVSAATKAAKRALNSPPWSALQPGAAVGTLVTALQPGAAVRTLVSFPSRAALIMTALQPGAAVGTLVSFPSLAALIDNPPTGSE
ncbi:hypothetical protein T484DRAFT_1804160 [Baffinella frigidus]|nr:hypothetical protein T484DRAFT_1804160 [Cryptophyta sp. CCMP2293]